MEVFRLAKEGHDPLEYQKTRGYRHGYRWNLPRVPVIYCASSLALCHLEMAVHAPEMLAANLMWEWVIRVPDNAAALRFDPADLPDGWDALPQSDAAARFMSAYLREAKALLYYVPSVVVKTDFNVLINPAHKRFYAVHIERKQPHQCDQRLADLYRKR